MITVNKFDTLKTLYSLWKNKHVTTFKVKSLLKKEHDLELISLTNEEIIAHSTNGKEKYLIK